MKASVGLITYMRTDSTRVSADALAALRQHIEKQYGKDYLPPKPNTFRSKKSAQDAHEAIRPTSLEYTPERVRRYLRRDAFQLYSLIWDRFVASQMVPAVFDQTAFAIPVREALFRATGQLIKFEGFMKVYIEGRDERAAQANGADDESDDESQDIDGVSAGSANRRCAETACLGSAPTFYPSAAALHPGVLDQGAGRKGYRPAIDLRGDYFEYSGPRICLCRTSAERSLPPIWVSL